MAVRMLTIGVQAVAFATTTLVFAGAALANGNAEKGDRTPQVDPKIALVTAGRVDMDHLYRVIVTVEEVYHHFFVDRIFVGEESSSPSVSSAYAIPDGKLGALTITAVDRPEWKAPDRVSFRINARSVCELTLYPDHANAVCQ